MKSLIYRDSFGAVALEGLVQETRTASVICTTESVFILTDKGITSLFKYLDEYRRIASGQDSEDQISLRISLLKNMNLFLECDPAMLEQVALKTRVTFHEQNAIILVTSTLVLILERRANIIKTLFYC